MVTALPPAPWTACRNGRNGSERGAEVGVGREREGDLRPGRALFRVPQQDLFGGDDE
jgi:hypothetical protein